MKKGLLILSIVIVLGTIVAGCNMLTTEDATPEAIPVVEAIDNEVSAESYIQPIRHVDLTFDTQGHIVEMLVNEGDTVEVGQVVARLDDTDLQAAVAVAEASLAKAQAELASAQAGPTEEEISQTRATILQAEAQLVKLLAGATPEEIALAEARVRTRQAEFNQVQAESMETDLDAVAADILLAEIDVQQAQAAYDEGRLALDTELRAADLARAKARLAEVQANYTAADNGATTEAIAVAKARLNKELATLNKTKAPRTIEEIAEAQITVQEAEIGLAKLLAGNTNETIAIYEAGVKQAEIGVQKALSDLADAELIAPFAGTITHLELDSHEYAGNGGMVMTLADTSEWLIETDDLTEIDVVGVEEGQIVKVRVDALPDEEFSGVVTKIKPQAETKAGDVTYTVEIKLNGSASTDARLRWGMTVQVDIVVETL